MKCKIILSSIICVITGIFLLGSCAKETDGEKNVSPDEVDVTVSVKLPGTYSSGTRALSDDDENAVNTIEVLVFEKDGTFVYTAYGRDITTVSGNQKTFDVTLRTGVYDIMILANSREELNKAISQGAVKAGATWAAVEKSLVSEGSGKWNSNPGTSGYKYLPMSGFLKAATIHESASTISGIKLLRTHAKTNIVLSTAAQADFKLKSVNLYNYMEDGQIAPTSANMNSGNNGVTAPSVPASAAKKLDPLVWDGGSIKDQKESVNEIYMFEAPAGSRIGYQTNTCLVIGGEWKGTTYYYRIDYVKDNGGISEYLPILRNHQYRVTINQISGPGYVTPHSAFESLPYNIDAQIEPWNEEDIDVHDDGQYQHSLRPVNIELWADGASGMKIDFRTTYTSWSYEKSDRDEPGHSQANPSNVSWLSVTSHTAGNSYTGNGNENEVLFNVAGGYTSSSPRTAYLHFNAGKFNGKVTVRQYNYRIDNIDLANMNDIKMDGARCLVQGEGIFDEIDVRAREVGSYRVLAKNILTGNKTSGTYYSALDIPATDIGERQVSFEYFDPRYGEWLNFRTLKQLSTAGYQFVTYVEGYAANGDKTSERNFAMTTYGTFPTLNYRARLDNNTILGTGQMQAGTATATSPKHVGIDTGNLPMVERRIYFEYSDNGGATWTPMIYLDQGPKIPEFTLTINHTEGQAIPAAGTTYNVIVWGTFPNISLRTAENGTTNLFSGTTINAGTASSDNPARGTIFVPSNTGTGSRQVHLQYSDDDEITWTTYSKGSQANVTTPAFDVSFGGYTAVIPAEGSKYTVTVTGTYPALYIRTATNNGTTTLDQITVAAGSGTAQRQIEVPAHRSSNSRTVQFQYSTNGISWVTKTTGTQQPVTLNNYVLKTGRIVALKDVTGKMDWAKAMGIDEVYNYKAYPQATISNYTLAYGPAYGGCGAYSEPGIPEGNWRLPNADELEEMVRNAAKLGMVTTTTDYYYWCSMEYTLTGHPYYRAHVRTHMNPVYLGTWEKISNFHVRCVAE